MPRGGKKAESAASKKGRGRATSSKGTKKEAGAEKKSSASKEERGVSDDIRRIEALEATVDDLQATTMELTKSLRGLISIGIGDENLNQILSSSIEGEVTGQVPGRIIGWANNRIDQVSPLSVSVFYGGKKIVSTIANKTIDQKAGKEKITGKSFSLMLPKQFYDGKGRSLHFKAGEIDAPLVNKLGAISFADGFPLEGGVSSTKDGVIKGWGIDHSEPKTPIVVSAMYGDEIVAKVVADLKDAKLSKKLGKANCHHGFSLALPENLGDGKKRNIRLVVSPWGFDLLGSPVECKFSI